MNEINALPLWPPEQSIVVWLQLAAAFQATVLCWHVHINHAIGMPRLVGLSDSYIPFAFALPQFLFIKSIPSGSLPAWFFGMAGYAWVAFWAHCIMYSKDVKDPENLAAFRAFGVVSAIQYGLHSIGRKLCSPYSESFSCGTKRVNPSRSCSSPRTI